MRQSEQVFSIRTTYDASFFPGNSWDNEMHAGGVTVYNVSKDRVEMWLSGGGREKAIHELTHGYQFLTGKMSFKAKSTVTKNGDTYAVLGGLLMDLTDEIEAFRRTQIASGKGVKYSYNGISANGPLVGARGEQFVRQLGYNTSPPYSLSFNHVGLWFNASTSINVVEDNQVARELYERGQSGLAPTEYFMYWHKFYTASNEEEYYKILYESRSILQ